MTELPEFLENIKESVQEHICDCDEAYCFNNGFNEGVEQAFDLIVKNGWLSPETVRQKVEELHNFQADTYDEDNGRRNLSKFVSLMKNKIDEVFGVQK